MKELAVLMIQCSNSGTAWYRLTTWSNSAFRNKAFNVMQPWYDKALLESHPWEVDIQNDGYRGRILGELDDHCKKADVVVFQMVHTYEALGVVKAIKAQYKIPLISEIDDNILSTPTYNPAHTIYSDPASQFRRHAIEQFQMSDAMIVSTPYLREVYGNFCNNIYEVPNSLDFRTWDNLKMPKDKGYVNIGWMGGASHNEDLRIVEPVIRKSLEKHPTLRFTIVHGIPDFLKNIERVDAIHEFTRIDRYPQFLAARSFDIGLAPLVDSAFNRAKSNLRWLEYAGLKVPCVASKVGHFEQTLQHGENVLLAESEQDWLDSLDFLIHDENARKQMGKNANKHARKNFNADINVWKYKDIVKEVYERGQVVKLDEVEA